MDKTLPPGGFLSPERQSMLSSLREHLRRPEILLLIMGAGVPISFATWNSLLNNFAIERIGFGGAEIGILQSLREIPGFLSFGVVFLLLFIREQRLAYIALAFLGVGTAVTGFFPSLIGLYVTTVVMSIGFHYYETTAQSLSLQWFDKKTAAQWFGRVIAVGSFAGIVSYALVYIGLELIGLDFKWIYVVGGGITVAIGLIAWMAFPEFPAKVEQRKHLVLRKRYWLYYALVFMSGARRQIFVVFAAFMLVDRFGFDAGTIALIFLANSALNMVLAPRIGKLIAVWGERRALTLEYIGLAIVFAAYAFVQSPAVAIGLYIVDHVFFAMAIAIKTYFQKIADPADIAPTAGVSFTINHIAAVFLPAAFGALWLVSPAAVFLAGAAMALGSLALSRLVPPDPEEGNEALYFRPAPRAAAPVQAAE
jgi:predicted MFS family arabinose efflux permease